MIGCQSLSCPDDYKGLSEHELESLLRIAYFQGKATVNQIDMNGNGSKIIITSASVVFISTRPAIFFTGSEETGDPIRILRGLR
jgi:hypothetical protein